MERYKRILKRREEDIFTYRLASGEERFAVRLQHHGKDWRRFGFQTISKARQWRDSRKGRALEGRLFPEQEQVQQDEAKSSIPYFRDYAQIWLATCRAKPLKFTTLRRYEGHVRKHLLPMFGTLRLDEIKRGHVRQLAAAMLEEGVHPKTIHKAVRALSAIFSQANEDELVGHHPAKNPSKLVKVPRKKRVEVFTLEEERQILEAMKQGFKEYFPFVLFLFRTGVREGEAVALQPEDIDFCSRYAWICRSYSAGHLEDSPKSGKHRKVDLSQDLVAVLKDHLTVQEAEAALQQQPKPTWVFSSPQGQLIRSNNFRDRVWRPVLKGLGLRYRNVHTIRHTYATRLIMAGANLVYVQKQLGHSTIQLTVDTYTHWIEEVERGSQLEVDRLVPSDYANEVGTFSGTLTARS